MGVFPGTVLGFVPAFRFVLPTDGLGLGRAKFQTRPLLSEKSALKLTFWIRCAMDIRGNIDATKLFSPVFGVGRVPAPSSPVVVGVDGRTTSLSYIASGT